MWLADLIQLQISALYGVYLFLCIALCVRVVFDKTVPKGFKLGYTCDQLFYLNLLVLVPLTVIALIMGRYELGCTSIIGFVLIEPVLAVISNYYDYW